jgi:hypothetical protein
MVFEIALPWTKTKAQKGDTVWLPAHEHILDPVRMLHYHLDINAPGPNDPLFSYIETVPKRAGQRRNLTKSFYMKHLNWCLEQEQLEPIKGHGIRIGAACLYLLWGFSEDWVQQHGRWGAKTSFKIYWRETQKLNLIQSSASLSLLPRPRYARSGELADILKEKTLFTDVEILPFLDRYPNGFDGTADMEWLA